MLPSTAHNSHCSILPLLTPLHAMQPPLQVLTGDAIPIAQYSNDGSVIVSAVQNGTGRVVYFSHETMLLDVLNGVNSRGGTQQLVINAAKWAAKMATLAGMAIIASGTSATMASQMAALVSHCTLGTSKQKLENNLRKTTPCYLLFDVVVYVATLHQQQRMLLCICHCTLLLLCGCTLLCDQSVPFICGCAPCYLLLFAVVPDMHQQQLHVFPAAEHTHEELCVQLTSNYHLC